MTERPINEEERVPETFEVIGMTGTKDEEAINVMNGSVFIAMPSRGKVHLDLLVAYMGLLKPKHFFLSTNVIPIDAARNSLVAEFLVKTPEATHLLFWDDDIIPKPNALLKLWSLNAPIASGLYFRKGPPHEPVMGIKIRNNTGEEGYSPYIHWEDDKIYNVDGVGMGFCLIRKDVFQNMEYPWFYFDKWSEDYQFCDRARELGYDIKIDTSVLLNHLIDKYPIGPKHFLEHKQTLLEGQTFFR